MDARPDTRPEIESHFWDINDLRWPAKNDTKPDLIIFDPPYFKKQSKNYDDDIYQCGLARFSGHTGQG